jgi:hypothetical protein
MTDTAMAGYVKPDYVPQKGDRPGKNPKYLAFMVANFPTVDKAILGLQKLKEELPHGLHIRLKLIANPFRSTFQTRHWSLTFGVSD